jgi:hypothetical protein
MYLQFVPCNLRYKRGLPDAVRRGIGGNVGAGMSCANIEEPWPIPFTL